MGFGTAASKKREMSTSELLRYVEPEDLLSFGLIPELIGRLPVVNSLSELNESALMKILLKPRNALIKQYKRLFEMDGISLEFEEAALKAIVKKAVARKMGARALRSVMEEFMIDIMYKLPSNLPEIKHCIITEATVLKKEEPIYYYQELKRPA